MTSDEEIYLSYLCDRIMAACNRINRKLDVMDEQQRLVTYTDSYPPLQYSAPAYVTPWQTTAEPYFHQPLPPPNTHQPTQPPDPPDWQCHSPTNNQPPYTAPPYDHQPLVDAGFHPLPDQLRWQQLYYHQISATSAVDQQFYTTSDVAAPPLQEPDRRMEVFAEMESHLTVTDRRVDSLRPPIFPEPKPPNAPPVWQQPNVCGEKEEEDLRAGGKMVDGECCYEIELISYRHSLSLEQETATHQKMVKYDSLNGMGSVLDVIDELKSSLLADNHESKALKRGLERILESLLVIAFDPGGEISKRLLSSTLSVVSWFPP